MSKFHYKVGSVETSTPWIRPTYDTLKTYLIDIRDNTDIMDKFEIYIHGKCLFDWYTWDVDLYLYGPCNDMYSLEHDMDTMYKMAFDKRLLLDLSLYENHPRVRAYTKQQKVEFTRDYEIGMIKHNTRVKKDFRNPERLIDWENKYTEKFKAYPVGPTAEMVTDHLVRLYYPANTVPYPKKIIELEHKLIQGAPINANIFIDTDINWWCANRDKIIGD